MPGGHVPHILGADTRLEDNIARINDNFDNVVQDLSDFGARRTGVATLTANLPGGYRRLFTVSITDPDNKYPGGIGNISPRLEFFVDVDNDDRYSWPSGSNLVGGMIAMQAVIYVNRRPFTGNVGTLVLDVGNFDGASHSLYCHIDADFLPVAPSGSFR